MHKVTYFWSHTPWTRMQLMNFNMTMTSISCILVLGQWLRTFESRRVTQLVISQATQKWKPFFSNKIGYFNGHRKPVCLHSQELSMVLANFSDLMHWYGITAQKTQHSSCCNYLTTTLPFWPKIWGHPFSFFLNNREKWINKKRKMVIHYDAMYFCIPNVCIWFIKIYI